MRGGAVVRPSPGGEIPEKARKFDPRRRPEFDEWVDVSGAPDSVDSRRVLLIGGPVAAVVLCGIVWALFFRSGGQPAPGPKPTASEDAGTVTTTANPAGDQGFSASTLFIDTDGSQDLSGDPVHSDGSVLIDLSMTVPPGSKISPPKTAEAASFVGDVDGISIEPVRISSKGGSFVLSGNNADAYLKLRPIGPHAYGKHKVTLTVSGLVSEGGGKSKPEQARDKPTVSWTYSAPSPASQAQRGRRPKIFVRPPPPKPGPKPKTAPGDGLTFGGDTGI